MFLCYGGTFCNARVGAQIAVDKLKDSVFTVMWYNDLVILCITSGVVKNAFNITKESNCSHKARSAGLPHCTSFQLGRTPVSSLDSS